MTADTKKNNASSAIPLILFLGIGSVFAPPTIVVFIVGMIPTFVARVVNPVRVRGTIASMAAFNLAGVIPVLGFLWQRGHSFDTAINLLSDVYMWLIMYGGAGMASFLLWGVPIVVQAGYEMQARQMIKRLEKRRQKMIEEWGSQILEDSKIMPANPEANKKQQEANKAASS